MPNMTLYGVAEPPLHSIGDSMMILRNTIVLYTAGYRFSMGTLLIYKSSET